MTRFRCFLLLLAIPMVSSAQHVAKFNFGLIRYTQQLTNSQENLQLLVKGNPGDIVNAINEANGRIKFIENDIASVIIPASGLDALLHHQGVDRVEGYHGFGKVLDDQTDIHTNVTAVHSGNSPLVQGYDGDSVIMGIIDTGIDFTHPDFQDSTGNTRILYIWDQNMSTGGTTPSFGYGQEWSSTEIDLGNCTHAEDASYYGHGSNVSGAAAGNGLALNKFAGMAPKSPIISVATNMGYNFLNNVADGVQYIFTRAQQLGMPASISASVGTYSGSHDGADLPAQLISQLIEAQNGRSMSASAGNAGNVLLHLGYDVEVDSAYSWFRYEPSIAMVYYELWANKTDFNNVWFSLGADKGSPSFLKRASTPYYNILSNFNLTNGIDSLRDTLYAGSNRMGIYTVYAVDYNDSTYQIAVKIFPDTTSYLWRLTTKGSGYFDCWSHPGYTGTSNIVKPVQLPAVNVYPEVARYRAQDYLQNIVGSFQCTDQVISVANYTNRTQFPNYYNDTTYYPTDTTGARALTSSIGPARDGRIKPDISAPGANTIAPGQLTAIADFIANNSPKVAEGGMHNSNGGTSMSSPVVGGIVALYLQKNPNASWYEIKEAIKMSAIQDQFTGTALPDSKWGYGKIDAFGMLTTNIVYGCDDTAAINYDSTVTISVLDSCLYTSLVNRIANELSITVFPNPTSQSFYIACKLPVGEKYELKITDVTGRSAYNAHLYNPTNVLKLDATTWCNGIYSCSVMRNGKRLQTTKLVKM